MDNTVQSILVVVVISLVTMGTRFLPFILFPGSRKIPKVLEYMGKVLTGSIMGMLIVYCFKNTVVTTWPFALPEVIATVFVVGMYLWKKNTLLSIGLGTVLYMILVQVVFV